MYHDSRARWQALGLCSGERVGKRGPALLGMLVQALRQSSSDEGRVMTNHDRHMLNVDRALAAKALDLAKRTRTTNVDVCLKALKLYHKKMADIRQRRGKP